MKLQPRTVFWGVFFAFCSLAALVGCGGSGGSSPGVTASIDGGAAESGGSGIASPTVTKTVSVGDSPFDKDKSKAADATEADLYPKVLLKTTAGDIVIRLDAQAAPVTVDNFLANYVKRGFYEGTIFHYVDAGSLVVGGGYAADGSEKTPRAEIPSEADNGLKNIRGAVAMARGADYQHSATSQFFFNLKDNPAFDFQSRESADTFGYCVFGKVVEGLDVVEKISASTVQESAISPQSPVEPVVIQSAKVVK